MVQASTILVAALAIAPVLAAPAPAPKGHHTGSVPPAQVSAAAAPQVAAPVELDARDPFSFRNAFKKIGNFAKKAGGVALKAAPLLIARDESGSLVELDLRELDFDSLVERDLDLDLDAREPFSFGKVFRKIGNVAKKAAGVALKAAPLILRDEDGSLINVEMREFFEDELETRDPEPKFNFRKLGRTALHAAKLFIRDEDGNVYYVREVEPSIESELEGREPKLRFGRVLKKPTGPRHQVRGQRNQLSNFGLREVDLLEELDARGFDDLEVLEELAARGFFDLEELEELAARDPLSFKNFFNKAKDTISKVLRTADTVSKKAHALGLREVLEERSIDELD